MKHGTKEQKKICEVPFRAISTSLTEHNTRVPITASMELSPKGKASPTYKGTVA